MAGMEMSIDFDFDSVSERLSELHRKQIPFAASLASTKTAPIVKQFIKQKIPQTFRNPVAWTKNAIFSQRSKTKPNKTFSNEWGATVWVKDFAPKGTAAVRYLAPSIYGGKRSKKRFERALIAKGVMRRNEWAMPGKGARKDRAGNMAKGQIVQILSQLKAHRTTGFISTRRQPRRVAYYVAEIGGIRGVWQRVGRGRNEKRRLVLYFTKKAPRYKKVFPFFQHAEHIIDRAYPRQFELALERAIATAR